MRRPYRQQDQGCGFRIVTAIGDAGYFVEDMNSSGRQIVLEIEAGSSMPYEGFMDEVVDDVRTCVGESTGKPPLTW